MAAAESAEMKGSGKLLWREAVSAWSRWRDSARSLSGHCRKTEAAGSTGRIGTAEQRGRGEVSYHVMSRDI